VAEEGEAKWGESEKTAPGEEEEEADGENECVGASWEEDAVTTLEAEC